MTSEQSGSSSFRSVLRLGQTPSRRYSHTIPRYQHQQWKVEPRSVFDYDPLEEGLESVSLGYLHNNVDRTVYEGYGKRDYMQMCSRKVKGIDAKPAISWVHGGQTRWSNVARLADASSKYPSAIESKASSLKINGVPVDIEQLMRRNHNVTPDPNVQQQHPSLSAAGAGNQQYSTSSEQQLSSQLSSTYEQTDGNSFSSRDVTSYDVMRERSTPDFVVLQPALPPLTLNSFHNLREPLEGSRHAMRIEQPLYKNFNRSAAPFKRPNAYNKLQ